MCVHCTLCNELDKILAIFINHYLCEFAMGRSPRTMDGISIRRNRISQSQYIVQMPSYIWYIGFLLFSFSFSWMTIDWINIHSSENFLFLLMLENAFIHFYVNSIPIYLSHRRVRINDMDFVCVFFLFRRIQTLEEIDRKRKRYFDFEFI